MDPLQDDMPTWSPYNYGFCNPVIFNDPSGNQPEGADIESKPLTKQDLPTIFKYGLSEYKHYLGSASLNIFVDKQAQNLIFVIVNSSSKWSYNLHWGEPENVNIKRTAPSAGYNNGRQQEKSTILNLYIWSEPIK